jgi:hypothetical protein
MDRGGPRKVRWGLGFGTFREEEVEEELVMAHRGSGCVCGRAGGGGAVVAKTTGRRRRRWNEAAGFANGGIRFGSSSFDVG